MALILILSSFWLLLLTTIPVVTMLRAMRLNHLEIVWSGSVAAPGADLTAKDTQERSTVRPEVPLSTFRHVNPSEHVVLSIVPDVTDEGPTRAQAYVRQIINRFQSDKTAN